MSVRKEAHCRPCKARSSKVIIVKVQHRISTLPRQFATRSLPLPSPTVSQTLSSPRKARLALDRSHLVLSTRRWIEESMRHRNFSDVRLRVQPLSSTAVVSEASRRILRSTRQTKTPRIEVSPIEVQSSKRRPRSQDEHLNSSFLPVRQRPSFFLRRIQGKTLRTYSVPLKMIPSRKLSRGESLDVLVSNRSETFTLLAT